MNSSAKVTIVFLLFIFGLAGLSTSARAYHGTEPAGLPPEPVQSCYQQAQVYQRYIIGRLAGLTLEETLLFNSFTVRISKYMIETSGHDPADADEEAALIDIMTNTIYEISEENLESQSWIQEFVTAEFDKCIAEIPVAIESLDEEETDAINRMLLE